MEYNIKEIWETIKKENEAIFIDNKEFEEVKEIQEERHKKLNKKLIFAIVKIKRRLTEDGRHEREIIVDNAIYQKHGDFIYALNTANLLTPDCRNIMSVLNTIEEAEQFVKEVIEKIKQELERIKEEHKKERELKEEEEILIY